jgi:hypothetical protein
MNESSIISEPMNITIIVRNIHEYPTWQYIHGAMDGQEPGTA